MRVMKARQRGGEEERERRSEDVGCSKTLKSFPPPPPAIPEGEPDLRARGLKSVRAFDAELHRARRGEARQGEAGRGEERRGEARRGARRGKEARSRDNSRVNLPRVTVARARTREYATSVYLYAPRYPAASSRRRYTREDRPHFVTYTGLFFTTRAHAEKERERERKRGVLLSIIIALSPRAFRISELQLC